MLSARCAADRTKSEVGLRVASAAFARRQYAALDHGHFGIKLHRREVGGEWVEVAVPEYPEKPEGVSDLNPMTQQERAWKLDEPLFRRR